MKVSEYIISCLKHYDTKYVFGIPGTSCSDFFDAIDQEEGFEYLVTTNELEAGYIADGYGRSRRIGAVCVSYGVGTLSLANAIASGYTERVPMIIINGGPTRKDLKIEREFGSLFSHSTGREDTDINVFEQITVFAGKVTEDPSESKQTIDAAFRHCLDEFRPVYLEVPQDMWELELGNISVPRCNATLPPHDDEFVEKCVSALADSERPVIFIGVELLRRNLLSEATALVEKLNIPFVTTALAKSFLPESHKNFLGCYDSDLFHSDRFKIVDESDCLLALGCIWGIDHREIVVRKFQEMIEIQFGNGRVFEQNFESVDLKTNLEAIVDAVEEHPYTVTAERDRLKQPSGALTHDLTFDSVNDFLNGKEDIQVVIDTCLGSFPGADLEMPNTEMYLANPVWLSIGQGTPASIGSFLANGKRPLIISGDGGFQMVAQTFSTMVKYKVPALVIVLDNELYAIEQYLIDRSYFEEDKSPLKYVKLNGWNYDNFPLVFAGGYGRVAQTSAGLSQHLNDWHEDESGQPWIIGCKIGKRDLPRVKANSKAN